MKVTYQDHMGSDMTVVNAAKVSFDKRSEWGRDPNCSICQEQYGHACGYMRPEDKRLIQFLQRGCSSGDWDRYVEQLQSHGDYDYVIIDTLLRYLRSMPTHWAPFAHPQIQLHFKAPIPIARQIFKHKVGAVESEVSRRYVSTEPEVFFPDWRKNAPSVKQGSSGRLEGTARDFVDTHYKMAVSEALKRYEWMLREGCCPEQARFVLPQGAYTEFVITGSLYHWIMFYRQRSDAHAQKEIQEVAEMVKEIVQPLFPVSWEAFFP